MAYCRVCTEQSLRAIGPLDSAVKLSRYQAAGAASDGWEHEDANELPRLHLRVRGVHAHAAWPEAQASAQVREDLAAREVHHAFPA